MLQGVRDRCNVIGRKIASHAEISKATVKAHPISSAIFATAILIIAIATVALFATGFGAIALIGVELFIGGLLIGSVFFHLRRETVRIDACKAAHSLSLMGSSIQGKEVCLALSSKADHNGAFNMDDGSFKLEGQYPVVHFKVSTVDEIDRAIKQVAAVAKIKVLWISAHGSQLGMTLGHQNDTAKPDVNLHVYNVEKLRGSLNRLDQKATVVLNSCETANPNPNPPHTKNIAQRISEVAKGRIVLAPTISITSRDLKIETKGGLKIAMQAPKWKQDPKTKKDHVIHGMGFALCLFTPRQVARHFETNVMRAYQDGNLQGLSSGFAPL